MSTTPIPFAAWRDTLPTSPQELISPVTYISTRSGVMVYRKLPYGVVVEELGEAKLLVDAPFPLPPPAQKLGVYLTTPKIPWAVFSPIVSFFRAVYKEHKSEAIIRVFYDPATDQWIPHCPEQQVSAGTVRHSDDFDKEGKFRHVADIHSHHTMAAFFSGTDDADEKKAVRLYGVVGLIEQPIPASSWRCWTGKKFLDLEFDDVCAGPEKEITLPVIFPAKKLMKSKGGVKELTLDGSELSQELFKDFPAEWMKQVKTQTYTVYRGGRHDDDDTDMMGFGWAGGHHHSSTFRGSVWGHQNGRRQHTGGAQQGKLTGDGKDTTGNTGAGDPPPLVDIEGPETVVVPQVLGVAKDTSCTVYLLDRKSGRVYRVYPDGRLNVRDITLEGLRQLRGWTCGHSSMQTLVYAVPELTAATKEGGSDGPGTH